MVAAAAACAPLRSCKPGCGCPASLAMSAQLQQRREQRCVQVQARSASAAQTALGQIFPGVELPPCSEAPPYEACSDAPVPFAMLFGAEAEAEAEAEAAAEQQAAEAALLVPLGSEPRSRAGAGARRPASKRKAPAAAAAAAAAAAPRPRSQSRPPPPPPPARSAARNEAARATSRAVARPRPVPTSAAAAVARRRRWQLAADTLDDLVPLSKLAQDPAPRFQASALKSNRAYEDAVRMQLSEPGAWLEYVRRQQAVPTPTPTFADVVARMRRESAELLKRKKVAAAAAAAAGGRVGR